jgi:hypothetical protein
MFIGSRRTLLRSNPAGTPTCTTNLLTQTQATGTETLGNTTGFDKFNGTETLTSSTEQVYTGRTKSLKVVTANSADYDGVYTTNTAATNNTQYTISAYVYGTTGTVIIGLRQMKASDNSLLADTVGGTLTLNSTWQRITQTVTTSSSNVGNIRMFLLTHPKQGLTYYINNLQIERAASASAWCLPST